ncbi:helix-turn-helix transcriptional regulator [Enterococcus sp. LJL99]
MKIERLLSLLSLLSTYDRLSAKELAERLEVSKRTIYRDIDTLNYAGIPIVSYSGVRGGFGIVEGYKISKTIFSIQDIAHIMTGLTAIQSISTATEFKPLVSKIAPTSEYQEQMQNDLLIDLSSWSQANLQQAKLDDLRSVIASHQLLSIYYHSKKKVTLRKIEPYKLIFKASDWYLYGFCLKRQAFRLFKLTRIQRYEVEAERFEPREIGVINLQLDGGAQWGSHLPINNHQEAVLTYDKKDRLFLIDKLGVEFFDESTTALNVIRFPLIDLEQTVTFILGLHDKVKVLEPPILVDAIKEKIEKIYSLYKS